MDEPKRGTKIFIGEQDIYLWMQENPQTIWPELITASEELLYTKQDEVLAFQVENRVNKRRGLFDLFVRKNSKQSVWSSYGSSGRETTTTWKT